MGYEELNDKQRKMYFHLKTISNIEWYREYSKYCEIMIGKYKNELKETKEALISCEKFQKKNIKHIKNSSTDNLSTEETQEVIQLVNSESLGRDEFRKFISRVETETPASPASQ